MKLDQVIANSLAKRDFFSEELKKKLLIKGFSEEEIENGFAKWKSRGYLNDEELALRFIEKCKASGYGPDVIKNKLYMRSKDQKLLSLLREVAFDHKESMYKLIAKKYPHLDIQDQKQKRRVFSFLTRKGFSAEVILDVFREMQR